MAGAAEVLSPSKRQSHDEGSCVELYGSGQDSSRNLFLPSEPHQSYGQLGLAKNSGNQQRYQ